MDSSKWGKIFTHIFGFNIHIIKDYESSNKPIKELYNKFKEVYRIPINLLEEEMNNKYLQYYYSKEEIHKYYNQWINKSTSIRKSYTLNEYILYEKISIENSYINIIQRDHYFDEGCACKACSLKRLETISKIMNGLPVKDKIVHSEAKIELIQKRVNRANNINRIISKLPLKVRGKNFSKEMSSIVSNGK
jgi:hypothetical protein